MFFQTFFQMMNGGVDYNLTVSRTDQKITVLVLPRINGLKDPGASYLVPFTITATPEEVDRIFFATLQQPVQNAAGILTNMSEFEQGQQKAQANSKATKEQKDKAAKDAKEKKEKYDKHFKKGEELEKAENFAEALTSYQQARLHGTDKEIKAVDEKIAAVKARMSQGSLFELDAAPAPAADAKPEPQQAAPAPQPQAPQPQQQGAPVPPVQQQMRPQPQPQPLNGQQPYPGQPYAPHGYQQPFYGQPAQGQPGGYQQPYPVQQQPQQAYQGIPQGYSVGPDGQMRPDPGIVTGEPVVNPQDYADMPDIQYTHVGQYMQNQ